MVNAFGECRSSGTTVKAWCEGQGIALKHITTGKGRLSVRPRQYALPQSTQCGMIMQIDPETMSGGDYAAAGSSITIGHGEKVIAFSDGSSVEAIAGLVNALNRHARFQP